MPPELADLFRYVDDVLAGREVVGRLERASVERFVADLENGHERGLRFDSDAAVRRIRFIEGMKHSTGEFCGQPFVLRPWQKFVIANLFGWLRSDGLRRFRDALITMGRGNGKSPLAAAILNCLMCLDGEARAEIKVAAFERDQARIVFGEARRQLESSDYLKSRCEFLKNSIVFKNLASSIVPLGGEGASKDGFNLHAFVADEIHAWTDEHRELWGKLETAMAKRRQPLSVTTTTAGSDRSTLWQQVYDFSRKVVERVVVDDGHFSFICEIDDDDLERCLTDETCWRKANPNLDVSVKRDQLQRFAARAAIDPVYRLDFLRYYMNRRVRDNAKPITPAMWKLGSGPLPELARRPCHAGLDLGWKNDLASLYLCFPLDDHNQEADASRSPANGRREPAGESRRRYALKGWNWIPREVPKAQRDLQAEPWASWIRAGHLAATDGNATDYESIYRRVQECQRDYGIKSIAADPNNARIALLYFVNTLAIETAEFAQTCANFNEAVREFVSALQEGRILHGDDPVLGWAADNMLLRTNAFGLVMPAKKISIDKIDPMVAALMAFARCLYSDTSLAAPSVRWL